MNVVNRGIKERKVSLPGVRFTVKNDWVGKQREERKFEKKRESCRIKRSFSQAESFHGTLNLGGLPSTTSAF